MEYLPPYTTARRTECQVTLSARNGIPPEPYELRGMIPDVEYHERMREIMGLLGKISWSLWERILVPIFVVVSFVAPMAVGSVLSNIFVRKAKNANALATNDVLFEAEQTALLKARGVALGVLVGTVVLFWVPYFVWKGIGNRKVKKLMGEYNNRDAAYQISWTIPTISLFSRSATVVVILPPYKLPSNFHPQAYLPDYMVPRFQPPRGPPPPPAVVPVGGDFMDEKE